MRRRRRRWRRFGIVAGGLLLLVLLGDGARLAWYGVRPMLKARDALKAAEPLAHSFGASAYQLHGYASAAADARAQAGDAARTFRGDPLVRGLRHVPWVGEQVSAGEAMAQVEYRGADALVRGAALLADLQARRATANGMIDALAGTYQANAGEFDAVLDDVAAMKSARSGIDAAHLVPPLGNELRKLDAKAGALLSGRVDIAAVKRALPGLLGRDRPSTFLLLLADNAELRPGGGFIGSYGTFGFAGGHFTKPHVTDSYVLDNPYWEDPRFLEGGPLYVAPPAPLRELLGRHSQLLRDATWYSSWSDDARQAQKFLQLESGQSVDGVVQVDPSALAVLLKVTGPIDMPDYNQVVDSSNVTLAVLEHTRNQIGTTDRKAFLTELADVFLGSLTSLPPSRWNDVLKAMGTAAAERHLFVYFDSADAQSLVAASHFDGSVQRRADDGIAVVFGNVGTNKTDYWMRRSGHVVIDGASGHHQVTLDLENQSPGYPGGRYHAYVRFYLPPAAGAPAFTGLSGAADDLGEEYGWHVFGGYVDIPQGGAGSVGAAYAMPPPRGAFAFQLVKQNGATPMPLTVRLAGAAAAAPGAAVQEGSDLVWTTDLGRDVELFARLR